MADQLLGWARPGVSGRAGLVGSLTLPPGARLCVDAHIIICSVEAHPTYWPVLREVWSQVQAGSAVPLTSLLTLLECLVHPLRTRDAKRVGAFEASFAQPRLSALDVTLPGLRFAAELRAEVSRSRTPDAIHAATALAARATVFLTNDAGFRGIRGLDVRRINDLLPTSP